MLFRSYNLDSIPIKTEQYSLLVLESEQSSPMVKKLIETLKSEKFRKKIEQMGGYTLDSPGEILY